MALNFPNNPSLDQVYEENGTRWIWNGSSWTRVASAGSQGFQGSPGSQGVQGTIGAQGSQGIQGSIGAQGSQGIQGTLGAQGLQGIQGTLGAQGSQGIQGTVGAQGSQGIQGTVGAQGSQGIQGTLGAQGSQGIQGTLGAQGSIGNASGIPYTFSTSTTDSDPGDGFIRYSSNVLGSVNTIFIDNIDKNLISRVNWYDTWDDSTTTSNEGTLIISNSSGLSHIWTVISLTFVSGYYKITVSYNSGSTPFNSNDPIFVQFFRTGDIGAQGSQGVQGTVGAQGVQGTLGAQGSQGHQGIQGSQGVQGSQGSQGRQGSIGAQGIQGSSGTTGTQGSQGIQGSIGSQGAQGVQGAAAAAGAQGSQGIPGAQGSQGVQGAAAAAGAQGSQGVQGSQGNQGVAGAQGAVGAQGSSNSGTITDDTTTNATRYPTFATSTSGAFIPNIASTKLTYNPSTGALTSTDFNSTSDIKLKTNVKPILSPLSKTLQLNGVTFNWIDGNRPSVGVIAQDVEKVFPELVNQTDPKTVNYDGLIGLLIEAVKELAKEVEELKKTK